MYCPQFLSIRRAFRSLIDSTRNLCYHSAIEIIDIGFKEGVRMSSSSSWKSILQHIIKIPTERQRLSEALGVTTMTLNRWVHGDSQPQRSHLLRLLQVVGDEIAEVENPHAPND